jgi:epoxyqueuosine reductase
MTFSDQNKAEFQAKAAQMIEEEIKSFTAKSDLNLMPPEKNSPIFDSPLVRFADGDDPLFTQYKSIIGPGHLTPREALSKACNIAPDALGPVSVISWILPITEETCKSERRETEIPSRLWSYTRWYGEIFNDALRHYLTGFLAGKGYLAAAPAIQSYFKRESNEKGFFSNWSERHVAYTAGQGTFSLSDGFITDRGIAHRCGSVVVNLKLPASPRTAVGPYDNCLFYADGSCNVCVARCPAGAITEKGHDKIKCQDYARDNLGHLKDEYGVSIVGCGLCQAKVPCEFKNPTGKI